jgi:methylamine dehydrogenase accessory protein MauD
MASPIAGFFLQVSERIMLTNLLATTLPWLLVAFGCWLVYQFLRQNGRILLRLEALEEQVAQLGAASAAQAPQGLDPGSAAPAFELPDLSGKPTSLAHWRGRRVLLIFFDPKCGFCEQMAADLAALRADGSEGRPIPLLITTGDPKENARFMDRHGIRCPILVQQKDEVSVRYQASGTPMGYLLDEEGVVAAPLAVGGPDLLALAAVLAPPAPKAIEPEKAAGGRDGEVHKGKANRGLQASRLRRDGLKAGTPAPPFRLPRLDGGTLSLEQFRRRRVFLVFSDPGCGPCEELAPALEQVHRGPGGVQVLMISRGDPEANRRKVAELGLTFPVVLQRSWEVSLLYAMFATPIAYLIDEQGVLATDVVVGVEPIRALLAATRKQDQAWVAEGTGAYAEVGAT